MDIPQLGSALFLVRIQCGYAREHTAVSCAVSEETLGMLNRTRTDVTVEILSKIADGPSGPTGCPTQAAGLSGMVEYFTLLEPRDDPEHPFTYGLLVCKDAPEGMYLLSAVHDVSTDPVLVLTMAKDFGSYALSPLHLCDAILDRIP